MNSVLCLGVLRLFSLLVSRFGPPRLGAGQLFAAADVAAGALPRFFIRGLLDDRRSCFALRAYFGLLAFEAEAIPGD